MLEDTAHTFSKAKIATPRSRVKHSTTGPPRSGADPEFLERGVHMYKGVCVCGSGGDGSLC